MNEWMNTSRQYSRPAPASLASLGLVIDKHDSPIADSIGTKINDLDFWLEVI